MSFRFRLSDEDREKYGGDEWTVFDFEKLVDLPAATVEAFEDASNLTLLGGEFSKQLDRGSHRVLRYALWLARACSGVVEPPLNEFMPAVLKATTEAVDADDADPPANRAERRKTRTSGPTGSSPKPSASPPPKKPRS